MVDPMAPTTLVVHAHPLDESYTEALLGAVTGALDDGEDPYRVVRLWGADSAEAGSGPGVDELVGVTRLIVVAPTWWGAMPAPVLGWIQDTLGPWIDGGRRRSSSPLRSVRRLVVVTSHGSSRLVNTVQGEPGRHLWKRIRRLCARRARFDWVALYQIDRLDEEARRAFIDQVGDHVRALVVTSSPARPGSRRA